METASGFTQLLENGALGLKKEGKFTAEFSAMDLDGLIRSMLKQSEKGMKEQGVSAQINELKVQIENGRGSVSTQITASKKVGFMNPQVDISAAFVLENMPGMDGQPFGKLTTTRLEVTPETLFMVVKPREFLAPYVEGSRINDTFSQVISAEMDRRGARVSKLSMQFTQGNRLQIEASGSAR